MTLFLFIVFYEETIYTPVLNGSIQGHGQVDGSNESKSNCGTEHRDDATTHCNTAQAENPPKSYLERLAPYTIASGSFINTLRHVYQPFIILVSFPGVTYVALVYGSLLAWLAIALNVLAADFTLPPYNFSASSIGLFNLAPFVGSLIGGLYGGPLSDWLILWLTNAITVYTILNFGCGWVCPSSSFCQLGISCLDLGRDRYAKHTSPA